MTVLRKIICRFNAIQDFAGGDLRERDHLEDPGLDGRIIIIKCICKKWVRRHGLD